MMTCLSTKAGLRIAVFAGCTWILAACAGPTPYQAETGGQGYAQQRLEDNRFRVSFAGNSVTPRQRVEDYLMFRAAELTLANGGDYFVVAHRETEPVYEDFGGPGYGGYLGRSYGYGGGVSTGLILGTGSPTREYRSFADIVIHRGRKPNDNPHAYDARALRARLAPTIERPVN